MCSGPNCITVVIGGLDIRPTIRPLFLEWRANGGGLSYEDFVTATIQAKREEIKRCDCGGWWEWCCDRCGNPICDRCDMGGARSLHDHYEGSICGHCKDYLNHRWED